MSGYKYAFFTSRLTKDAPEFAYTHQNLAYWVATSIRKCVTVTEQEITNLQEPELNGPVQPVWKNTETDDVETVS